MTGLADCNNFFVSCERSVNPALEGRPVIVLSNNDGCAIARSNEAKRMGVRMGQPAFELRELIQSGRLIALSGNHVLYHDISVRIHDIFRRYVPETIDYSVDEAFLDFNGIPQSIIPDIGARIVSQCLKEEKIPVTVGVAPTKTLAKIATEVGKKRGERVVVLSDKLMIEEYANNLDIQDVWGIGRRLAKRLFLDGIRTAGNLMHAPMEYVRKTLGVNGEKTWHELNGTPCIELSHLSLPLQQSISQTRTFPEDIGDFDYIRARIAIYAAECAKRLRAMHGKCDTVSVFLRTNRFHPDMPVHRPEVNISLSTATTDSTVIADAALKGLIEIFRPGMKYKRAGVLLSGITPADIIQHSLFEEQDADQSKHHSDNSLMSAIDKINAGQLGYTVKLASQITSGTPGHNDGYSSSFGFRN